MSTRHLWLLSMYPLHSSIQVSPRISFGLMGCWSPLYAMNAYMHTLQLCKDYYNHEFTTSRSKSVEPNCMEFISALAAGNQAQLMVDVSPGRMSSSTLALAVAARHTGGRLICVRREQEAADGTRAQLESFDLGDVAEFEVGDPCEMIKKHKSIDFAVVDRTVDGFGDLFLAMDMNLDGSVVVVSNLLHGKRVNVSSYGQVVKGRTGIESVSLPIGEGMEMTKIGRGGNRHCRRFKRTFVVYEN